MAADSPIRVLLVDANPDSLKDRKSALLGAGYQVDTALDRHGRGLEHEALFIGTEES